MFWPATFVAFMEGNIFLPSCRISNYFLKFLCKILVKGLLEASFLSNSLSILVCPTLCLFLSVQLSVYSCLSNSLSIHPLSIISFPKYRFSWNFCLEFFFFEISLIYNYIKVWRRWWVLYVTTFAHIWLGFTETFYNFSIQKKTFWRNSKYILFSVKDYNVILNGKYAGNFAG